MTRQKFPFWNINVYESFTNQIQKELLHTKAVKQNSSLLSLSPPCHDWNLEHSVYYSQNDKDCTADARCLGNSCVQKCESQDDCHRDDTQCVHGTCTRTCTGTGETCGATGWVCEDSLCVKSCNIKQDCHYSQVSYVTCCMLISAVLNVVLCDVMLSVL